MADLTFDEIDDLLYFTRTNSLSDLEATLTELSQRYSIPPSQILSACIDPESKNTPLHYAAANGLNELVENLLRLLTQQAPQDQSQPTPSSNLTNAQNAQGNTPLHWSALNGHLAVVKLLLTAGADMWLRNSAGHLAMFEAERAARTEVVQFLLEAGGTEVEKTGREGAVPAEEEAELRDGDGDGEVNGDAVNGAGDGVGSGGVEGAAG